MSTYEIKRWDVMQGINDNITVHERNRQYPVIYIKPDNTFIEFAKANNNVVMVELIGTIIDSNETPYDDQKIPGTVYKSSDLPKNGSRPNFYEETGLWCIVLESEWKGYPFSLGSVKFYGLNEAPANSNVNVIKNYLQGTGDLNSNSSNDDNTGLIHVLQSLTDELFVYFVMGILVLIVIMLISFFHK